MAADEQTGLSKSDEDKILEELKERFDYATDQWAPIREEARKDMRYVAGDPWEKKQREAREDAGRPCLTLDELGQYVNQTINDVRQNKRAIKVTPQGGGADDKSGEFRQNLIRQIENRSNAQMAYTAMFENAVQRSYGWLRIKAQYLNEKSFDQELRIVPIPDPDSVTADPDFISPDGSDIAYAFITEVISVKQFKRDYPDAKVQDFETADAQKQGGHWIKGAGKRIRIAEYWTIEHKRRKLLLIEPAAVPGPQPLGGAIATQAPISVFEDELPEGVKVTTINSRWVDVPYVCQYMTNGLELLAKKGAPKKTKWPGKSIPLVLCPGKILYVDMGSGTERRIESQIRKARDPQMLANYYATTEAELVGMTPKVPAVGYEGQFDGRENEWAEAAHVPKAYLTVKATTERTGSQILPLPQFRTYDPPIQAMEMGRESARRAIQAAMGITPLPTSAQRRNEKSGVALRQIEDSTQRGSYHFVDHYEASITRTGAILDELIPFYYDNARDVTTRKPDESTEIVRINDPNAQGGHINATAGDFDVTISVGPAYASQREEAADFAETLINTPFAPLIADLVVRLRQLGPIGDEIADRLTPEQFRDQSQAPSPAQVQQMQQQMQEMQQALQEAQRMIETEQAKQQAIIEKAQIEAERDLKLAEIESRVKMAIAELETRQRAAAAEDQAAASITKTAAEAVQADKDRAHQERMAQQQAGREAERQGLEHGHASQMADKAAAAKTDDKKRQ